MRTLETIIQTEGFYMTAAEGISMLPLVHPKVDTVVIEKIAADCLPMDIILYQVPAGKLVLHRVIANQGNEYLVCGDNCITLEHVDKKSVLGKMTCFYRKERKVDLQSLLYQLYVLLWCRPYRVRIFLIKCKNRIKQGLKRMKRKAWRQ